MCCNRHGRSGDGALPLDTGCGLAAQRCSPCTAAACGPCVVGHQCTAVLSVLPISHWRQEENKDTSSLVTAVMSVTVLIMSLLVERLWVVLPHSPYFDSAAAMGITFLIMLFGGCIAFLMVCAMHCTCCPVSLCRS